MKKIILIGFCMLLFGCTSDSIQQERYIESSFTNGDSSYSCYYKCVGSCDDYNQYQESYDRCVNDFLKKIDKKEKAETDCSKILCLNMSVSDEHTISFIDYYNKRFNSTNYNSS